MKKIRVSNEGIYVAAAVVLSFATAMMAAADLGMSMVIAPAYIVSMKAAALTFGQAEYIVQGMLFILFCVIMGKVKPMYFFSFVSGLVYGAVLDFWRMVIPHFNPERFAPGAFPLSLRILYFIVGFMLNSLGVALYFKTYFYPQVYEFFVKGVSGRFGIKISSFKIGFDLTCLVIAAVFSWLMLGRIAGIGPGTVVLAFGNGVLIGMYGKWMERRLDMYTKWKWLEEKFSMS